MEAHDILIRRVLESRTMEKCWKAGRANDEDEFEDVWGGTSFYADQHHQSGIDIL